MSLQARVARSLEAGRGGVVSTLAARAWDEVATSRLVKPLSFRDDAKLIAIGGSTLGGSGKTPLAIACAQELARLGERVALVGHAYRANPGRARVVSVEDDVDIVGDEALVCARALASSGALVVVGPTRQSALDQALDLARIAVLDGVAQLRPTRAHLSLLALDATHPWGSGACPPCGDLRASQRSLLAVCDRIVRVGPASPRADVADQAVRRVDGAWLGATRLGWDVLRTRRVGLWTALARPDRVLATLTAEQVIPALVVAHGDHLSSSPRETASVLREARRVGIDLWLTTAKCATRLPAELGGVPVATLNYSLLLEESLQEALRRAVSSTGSTARTPLTDRRSPL